MPLTAKMTSESGFTYRYFSYHLNIDDFARDISMYYIGAEVRIDLISKSEANNLIRLSPSHCYYIEPGRRESDLNTIALARRI